MIPLGVSASGRTSSWTPAALPGLAAWYDAAAAATLTLSGSTVTAWSDKSGAGMHVTQASTGPTRGTATLAGTPVLTFGGSHRLRRAGTALMPAAGTISVVMRVNTTALPTYLGQPFSLTAGNQPAPADHWHHSPGLNNLFAGMPDQNQEWHPLRSQSTWGVLTTARKLVAGTASAQQWFQGSSVLARSWSSSAWRMADQALCVGQRDDGVVQFVGDLAEIVVTNTWISDADRAALESYLRAKWGI